MSEGIGPGLSVAASQQRPDLVAVIDDAFVDGMALAFWSAAAFGAVVAVVVWLTYPNKASEPDQVTDTPESILPG